MSLKQSRVAPRDGKEEEKKTQKDSYLMFLWKGTPHPNNNISPLPLPHHLPLTSLTLVLADKVKLIFRLYFICLLSLFFLFKMLRIYIVFVYDFMHEVLLQMFK
jgi:hypothetical protein